MEDQFKDTDNTDSTQPPHTEKKAGSPFAALVFSLVPVIYGFFVIFTGGALLFLSILLFPIILFVLIAPIIGMIKGVSFLDTGEGTKAEKIIAVSAVALPLLSVAFAVMYFANSTTSIAFSM